MITSTQNPLIKHIINLRDSKYRRQEGLTLVDGKREIERALRAGIAVKHIVSCPALLAQAQRGKENFDFRVPGQIQHTQVNEKVFGRIAFGDREDGMLAIAKPPALTLSQMRLSKNPIVVVLDALEKPGNLGAILRSCDGAGVEAVFISNTKTDVYNPNVIRASTGIVFSLPVIADSVANIQSYLLEQKITLVAATPSAKKVYTKLDYTKPVAFILGTEDKGLNEAWLKLAQEQVTIPMKGRADSLNVSVTAALLIYEAQRQRE